MWFKSLQIFQLLEDWTWSIEDLHEKLYFKRARDCGKTELFTLGWEAPFGEHSNYLAHPIQGQVVLCMRRQERVLPAMVVRDEVEARVAEIQATEDRKVGSKEKRGIREEITLRLLPQAFTQTQTTYAYIDVARSLLIVNSGNRARAEAFTVLLRQTLGSLPLAPLATQQTPARAMSSWLADDLCPSEFTIDDYCEMFDPKLQGRGIRFNRCDLHNSSVLAHLNDGKQISKLAMTWQERISFVLEQDLSLKRIKFEELVRDMVEDVSPETEIEQLEADMLVMSGELGALLDDVFKALGGREVEEGASQTAVVAEELA